MKEVSEKEYELMSMIFQMFADRTRLKILHCLFEKECHVNEIVERVGLSQSAISHQLSSLKKTRIVRTNKVGRKVYYCLDDEHIESIFKMTLDHIHE
ncbi:MAG: ArsR/SmtB family transcription factor [Anaerorhabdus sp.]